MSCFPLRSMGAATELTPVVAWLKAMPTHFHSRFPQRRRSQFDDLDRNSQSRSWAARAAQLSRTASCQRPVREGR